MAQCRGTTRKGEQCKRDAGAGSEFCVIHQDQEIRARTPRDGEEWDRDAIMRAAVGFAIVGLILFFGSRR